MHVHFVLVGYINPRGECYICHRGWTKFCLIAGIVRVEPLYHNLHASWALSSFSWAVITIACRRLFIHIHLCEQNAAYHDDLHAFRPNSTHTDSESAIELHSYKTNRHWFRTLEFPSQRKLHLVLATVWNHSSIRCPFQDLFVHQFPWF